MERYRIIYTWKMLENMIPNCGLTAHFSARRGRLINVNPVNNKSSARIKSIREGSFIINGPRLFNSLPAAIRNISNCTVESFKNQLDQFLLNIPDEPICDTHKPNAINQVTGRFSNSLIDQIRKQVMTTNLML